MYGCAYSPVHNESSLADQTPGSELDWASNQQSPAVMCELF